MDPFSGHAVECLAVGLIGGLCLGVTIGVLIAGLIKHEEIQNEDNNPG